MTMLALLLVGLAHADEGMWLPEQMTEVAPAWQERGLELAPDALADPMGQPLGAIVTLGFCSASFISADGLMATNHHCVEGYLGALTTPELPYRANGHASKSQADELSTGPTGRVRVVESMADVTDRVLLGIKSRTKPQARYDAIALAKKQLVSDCEEQPGRRCSVRSFDNGLRYRLVQALELQDVRLVYAPAYAQGQFGGEIDNWMWPRHGADFALLRAYVAPDGSPAPYSQDNVPYKPAHHLEVAPGGVGPGDMVMVAGFPGSTARHRLAMEVQHSVEVRLPRSQRWTQDIIDLLQRHIDQGGEAAARLPSPVAYLHNRLKNGQGTLDGFKDGKLLARKLAQERKIEAWVAYDRKRSRTWGRDLAKLRAAIAKEQQDTTRDTIGRYAMQVDLLAVAHRAYRLSIERSKPDLERDGGYQDRDRARTEASMKRKERTLYLPADRDLLAYVLDRHSELPPEQHLEALDDWIDAQGGKDAALERLFSATELADTSARLALIQAERETLEASDDPWVQLAIALEQGWFSKRRAHKEVYAGTMLRYRPSWLQATEAYAKAMGTPRYHDANSTLRITLGHVEGYAPKDGLWAVPQTTLPGLAAKAGPAPFDIADEVLQRIDAAREGEWADPELGHVPVNFLSTLDITGGNSGSATLDGQGRFVGVVFDGNYESVASDWVFDRAITRAIHCDIRYMLWTLDGDSMQWLISEMGVNP